MTSEGAVTLIAGCGDLGTEVGLRLAAGGDTVVGMRRTTSVLPPQIRGLSVDLTARTPELPDPSYDRLAIILTAHSRDAQAYRETYVGGLRRTLDAVEAGGCTPQRAVLVSSTGVYGDSVGDLDETSPAAPSRTTHEVLLDAEDLFAARLPHGTVLRLSGLYGPGRSRFIEKARAGEVVDAWTNRIHRDDAAGAVVHVLTAASAPPPLLLATDTEPAHSVDVADHIRRELGLAPLDPRPRVRSEEGRRLSCARLLGSGFTFTHPTFREGYTAILRGEGRRHP